MNSLLGKKVIIDGEIYDVYGVNTSENELITIRGNLNSGIIKFIKMESIRNKEPINFLICNS